MTPIINKPGTPSLLASPPAIDRTPTALRQRERSRFSSLLTQKHQTARPAREDQQGSGSASKVAGTLGATKTGQQRRDGRPDPGSGVELKPDPASKTNRRSAGTADRSTAPSAEADEPTESEAVPSSPETAATAQSTDQKPARKAESGREGGDEPRDEHESSGNSQNNHTPDKDPSGEPSEDEADRTGAAAGTESGQQAGNEKTDLRHPGTNPTPDVGVPVAPMTVGTLSEMLLRLDPRRRFVPVSGAMQPVTPESPMRPIGAESLPRQNGSAAGRKATQQSPDEPAIPEAPGTLGFPQDGEVNDVDQSGSTISPRQTAGTSEAPNNTAAVSTESRQETDTRRLKAASNTAPSLLPEQSTQNTLSAPSGQAAPAPRGPASRLTGQEGVEALNPVARTTASVRGVNSEVAPGPTTPTDRTKSVGGHPAAQFAAQVDRAVEAMANQRGGSVLLRLHPESLGQMRVHMSVKSGSVRVRFEVGTVEARRLLHDTADTLHRSMQGKGLSVDKVVVELSPSLAHEQIVRGTQQPQPELAPQAPPTAGPWVNQDGSGGQGRPDGSERHWGGNAEDGREQAGLPMEDVIAGAEASAQHEQTRPKGGALRVGGRGLDETA